MDDDDTLRWPAFGMSPTHGLPTEVSQQQRQPDTERNHDHRRHAAPRA